MEKAYQIKFKNIAKDDFLKHSEDCHHAHCFHKMEPCEDMCAVCLTDGEMRKLKDNPNVVGISEVKTYRIYPYQSVKGKSNAQYNYALTKCQERTLEEEKGVFFFNANSIGTGVDVVITDTGVNANHVEFRDSNGQSRVRKIPGSSSLESIIGDSFQDPNGHGTHVAGTACGKTVGWARNSLIYSARILDQFGSGSTANIISWFRLIINWHKAKTNGRATVVNMSWGGSSDDQLNDILLEAHNAGIVLVAAAGNESKGFTFSNPPSIVNYQQDSPGSSKGVISVGSSTTSNQASSFSNYGARVDIFAPGNDILSADAGSANGYTLLSGTSMASPQVCGVIATVLSGKGKPTNASRTNDILLNHFWGKRTGNQYYMPPSVKHNGLNNDKVIATSNTGINLTQVGPTMGKLGPTSRFPATINYADNFVYNKDGTFTWTEIVTNSVGTKRALGDDAVVTVNLPFNYGFYGQTKTQIKVGSNGYCTFAGNGTRWYNLLLPADSEVDGIFPLWGDLNPANAITPETGVYTHGNANRFVVTWYKCPSFSSASENTFQMVLFPDGKIRFAYKTINGDINNKSTIGVQEDRNATNNRSTQIRYDGTNSDSELFALTANSSVLLTYEPVPQYNTPNYLLFKKIFSEGTSDWKVYDTIGLKKSGIFNK